MAEVLVPPTDRPIDGPLVFLAGPIQGAPNWQAEAAALLSRQPGLTIASPRRPEFLKLSPAEYAAQVDWEHRHLERAGVQGVTLFWLAREAAHRCDRAYAQTTRFELGEAVTRHRWQGIKVVVGIEAGFSNARYLRQTIASKAPAIPLCDYLPQTCDAALRLLGMTPS